MEFRKLKAEEIDVRVARLFTDSAYLLLYKDARVDQNILDETVGMYNWQRKHEVIDGNLYCTVSLYDGQKEAWVSKQDVGTESNTEKEKGQASDSFKRACFNWGIGRELYTAPQIKVYAQNITIKDGKSYDKFYVREIGYDDAGNINALEIINKTLNKVAFTFAENVTDKERKVLENLVKNKGYEVKDIFPQGLDAVQTTLQYVQAVKNLNAIKAKAKK